MKVCYIAHRTNLNGASRSLLDLLDGIDRTRFEPIVLVNSHGPFLNELKQRGIPYRFAPIIPSLNSDDPLLDFIKRALNFPPLYHLFLSCIKLQMKRIGPDIVHNNTMLSTIGMQAAKDLDIPYICHHRELLWEGFHRKLIREEKDHKLIREASANISISELVKNAFRPYAGKEINVIPDGIHIENYDLPLHDILSGKTVTLLLAGRIDRNKGQLDAVKAVEIAHKKSDKDLQLRIIGAVGDQTYADELRDYVSSHSLDYVSIEDFAKDLSALRKDCDIGLTCSYTEGLGRVTIENMLSSLLVIASDSGGTLEIISDRENGLFYRTGSPEDLAEKIEWAIHHPECSQQIAAQGHDETLRTFDCKAYASRIEAIYDSIQRERN